MITKPLEPFPVRFYAYFTDLYSDGIDEIDEITLTEFEDLKSQGFSIDYERHTIFDNGVRQICLYIMNEDKPIEVDYV